VSWQFYQTFLRELADRPIRLTFDRGSLEIMAPSFRHERYGGLLGRMVEMLTLELNIPIVSGRSTTFQREDLERGLEPDQCYYIRNEPRVRGKMALDLRYDPAPDLAIEVDISHSSLNRMAIYGALGVPENWCFDGENLLIHQLRPNPDYELCQQSACFPFLPVAELVPFLHQAAEMDETSLMRSFRDWVRQKILPDWQEQT
jgi:Uma2 family endonuclease